MSLTPTTKKNPCFCGNTTGKCRQGKEDLSYWQCMTYADSKKGEIVGGYKCLGTIKNGLWAQFRPDNSDDWTSEKQREWQAENQRRAEKKAREDEKLARGALLNEARDEAIRKLHKHFGLSARHREDLRARGLSDEVIDNRLYFSISPNQEVPHSIPANLPGVSYGQIKAAGTGYACVTFDPEGRATGWQVRLDDVQDNKYRWAKGARSSHLASGELPITSGYPVGDIRRQAIGVCEGISKPGIAAHRLGQIFIGASGANFASSPEQTREHLLAASQRLGTKQIEFAADAGAVSNPHILKAYRRSWELFAKLGYEVRVSWWGQIQKDAPDIDELQPEQIDQILRLTVSEFEAICREHGSLPKEGFARGIRRQIERGIQNLAEKLAPLPEKNGFEESEPDPDEYAAHLQQEQQQLEIELAQAKEHQQQLKQSYPERAKAAWRKARRFTADIQKATQWFEADLPPENSIFFGRAGLGRGKSTQLSKWVKQWKQQGKGFICLGYRNTLLLQLCDEKRLGFYHLHESDSGIMQRDPSSGIALCVDSLWRFQPEDFDGKIIIIDELMSVIRHLLHSPTVKGRDNILELFHQALQRASQVVCLDGNLADWSVQYLHELAPDKKIIRLDNTYQGDKALINFLLGTVDIDEEVRKNDRSPWLHHLLNESQVPAICADSQVFAESLDNLLTERGLKVLRIDSKTVPEDYIKECLKNCDAYIEQHHPDVLIYTPSAESGIDVSIKGYFTHHYGFFFGVLGVDAILQMLGRIRDSQCIKFVWVREWVAQSEQTHSRSPFTKSVGKAVEQMLSQDITDTFTSVGKDQEIIAKLWGIIQQSKNSHFQASNQIQAISNYEKGNLRECVLESLKASGYKVRCCTLNPEKATGEIVKGATEATKRQNCRDIFTAEKIAVEFVKELTKKFDAKWEDRVKVIQATYRDRLPGIDETESWSEEFIYKIKYDNPDFLSQQEMFWLFNHPEVALRMNQERYYRLAQKEYTFIGNIRSRMAKIKALRDIGIEPFLDPENLWQEDSPELKELVTRCRDELIAAALGKHPGQQTNIRFLGSLLKMLGLKHTGQKVKSDDGDYRVYRLDRNTLTDTDRLNALKCLDTRWTSYLTQEVEILDWDSVLDSQEVVAIDNNSCQQGGGHSQQVKTPQTQSQQAFDPVPRTPSEYIYINEGFVEPNKSQGVTENLGGAVDLVDPVESLLITLPLCDTVDEFAALVESHPAEVVEKAIGLQDSQPRRRELAEWHQQLSQELVSSRTEPAHEPKALAIHPSLDSYQPGQAVWGHFPQSDAKWLRATVEWVRNGMIQVQAGFLGMLIEQPELIAPGHWLMSG